jgi:pseudouridine-5'-phosphate glycosidase
MSALVFAAEVRAALDEGRPVVALESTIVAHGLPWPRNLEAAEALEAEIRAGGAVPATIAVLGGRLHVGLDEAQRTRLARDGAGFAKLAARDLGGAVARGRDGATTVSATMTIAHRADIAVFATGGIGGVHRGAEASFDVSADLTELARTPVAVVCAGAKAILDLARTLELLETWAVPVIGVGTDRFPAFWCRSSGLALDLRCDSAAEIASVLAAHWRLGGCGAVVANPIPEADALPADVIERAIAAALADAAAQGIAGKAVTPFLLARIEALTEGRSVTANLALARNNARLAAALATALAAASPPA